MLDTEVQTRQKNQSEGKLDVNTESLRDTGFWMLCQRSRWRLFIFHFSVSLFAHNVLVRHGYEFTDRSGYFLLEIAH